MVTPYLTVHLPGIGGCLKSRPEDFLVEEIPLYQPTGQGQHTYVTIEKRGISTYAAIKTIARALNVSPKDVGHAGLKDANAVARQTLSIPLVDPQAVAALELPRIKILAVNRHGNKLKTGHLAGNRFSIRVRSIEQSALSQAQTILDVLAARGAPNFFGQQRFGNRNNTDRLGEALVRGNADEFVAEYLGRPQPHETPPIIAARQLVDEGKLEEALQRWPNSLSDEKRVLAGIINAGGRPEAAFKALNKKLKGLFVSAFQSAMFNRLLVNRLDTLDRLQTGDVAYIHGKGAAFLVEDAMREQPRADRFEISPSGPLFGPKTLLARNEPGQREQALLDECALTLGDFKVPGLKIYGARRPYRIQVKQPTVQWDDGLVISFELEPGAYATTVMAEIMKSDQR